MDESIFGTDGVRDLVGRRYLEPDSIDRIARAVAALLRERERFPEDVPPGRGAVVAIGRDTRASGEAITAAFAEALRGEGFGVWDLGVLPTAGVARIAADWQDVALGVVVSASHNPAEYNGIKLLSSRGQKISTEFELEVSRRWHAGSPPDRGGGRPGEFAVRAAEAEAHYVDTLIAAAWHPERIAGRRIALDTAHGAAFRVARLVFDALGADVVAMGMDPNGQNINDDVGALHPGTLARVVRETGAFVGFSFDGDADRMIPVTTSGNILDGDYTLALAGRAYDSLGLLSGKSVVATVMSNLGLERSLAAVGLELLRTPVGDRHVFAEIVRSGHVIGGEQSGHLIFLDAARTGDGVLAALRFLDVLGPGSADSDAAGRALVKYPQVLKSVVVPQRVDLEELGDVAGAIRRVESRLGEDGRILVRYSGTEPLVRVMIEGQDAGEIDRWADEIVEAVRVAFG